MAASQVITAAACNSEEVRDILAAGISGKTDTSGGRQSLDYFLAIGQTFKVQDETGAIRGGYILKADGPELWVLFAAGCATFDLVRVMLALIEAQGRGYESIGFITRRRGLVKKAAKQGFAVVMESDGVYKIRKNL